MNTYPNKFSKESRHKKDSHHNTHTKNQKNTRVKINGKKVFINIQSFYKENKRRRSSAQNEIRIRQTSINKENGGVRKQSQGFYHSKNYLKYNSLNSGKKKNRQNLTGHANILAGKKGIRGSAQKLRASADKRRYAAVKTMLDASHEFGHLHSRRKILRKF